MLSSDCRIPIPYLRYPPASERDHLRRDEPAQHRKDALGKSESYQYDGNGNLIKYTDRNGHYVNYTYDGINRRTIANFQGSTDVINYTWDGGDRLTQGRLAPMRRRGPSPEPVTCWTG